MVDNSWIKEDRDASGGCRKLTRLKVLLSIFLLIMGGTGVLIFHDVGSSATLYQSEGIVVDFGDYKTCWTDVNYSEESENPVEMLNIAALEHGMTVRFDNGVLVEISAFDVDFNPVIYTNGDDGYWGLWTMDRTSNEYVISDTYDVNASDYKIVTWAYVKDDGKPTVAIDYTGTSIYGYEKPTRIVTLSPVSTEIVGSMRAASAIVGTDMYSDYPKSVSEGIADKSIKMVGTYTDPSYEAIMSLNPDMVICDGSQYSHVKMANSLRNSNVNCVVISPGFSIEGILDNIYIVGAAMNYEQRAEIVDNEISNAVKIISDKVYPEEVVESDGSVLVTLGSDPSPYVAGTNTYVDDIIVNLGGYNVASSLENWPQAISEFISEWNPSTIIVLDDGRYGVNEYDLFLDTLSKEWKSTDAFKNGRVYLLTEDMGNMAMRAGPRIGQVTEIFAHILDPDAFSGTPLPNAIGNGFEEYLTITKDMGYDL